MQKHWKGQKHSVPPLHEKFPLKTIYLHPKSLHDISFISRETLIASVSFPNRFWLFLIFMSKTISIFINFKLLNVWTFSSKSWNVLLNPHAIVTLGSTILDLIVLPWLQQEQLMILSPMTFLFFVLYLDHFATLNTGLRCLQSNAFVIKKLCHCKFRIGCGH